MATDIITHMKGPFVHYGREAIEKIKAVKQSPPQLLSPCEKPAGLYFAVGEQWAEWCEREGWGLGPIKHTVTLKPHAKILLLTKDTWQADLKKYRVVDVPEDASEFLKRAQQDIFDWAKVAQDFDGVYVAYHEIRRGVNIGDFRTFLQHRWVLGYDVDTLVLFNAEGVQLFKSHI